MERATRLLPVKPEESPDRLTAGRLRARELSEVAEASCGRRIGHFVNGSGADADAACALLSAMRLQVRTFRATSTPATVSARAPCAPRVGSIHPCEDM